MSDKNFKSYRQIMDKVWAKAKVKGYKEMIYDVNMADKEMIYDVNMADSIVWKIKENKLKKQREFVVR